MGWEYYSSSKIEVLLERLVHTFYIERTLFTFIIHEMVKVVHFTDCFCMNILWISREHPHVIQGLLRYQKLG